MLLPYYIASLNIEHQFYTATHRYAPYEGVCLVDTFEMAEERQIQMFTPANTARVAKMKLSKDKTSLVYNNFLTIAGIPIKAFDYRLGTRSALEWVTDQYRVKTDKRTEIVNDPNRVSDDPQYIVKLIGKVITVSLETVDLVAVYLARRSHRKVFD